MYVYYAQEEKKSEFSLGDPHLEVCGSSSLHKPLRAHPLVSHQHCNDKHSISEQWKDILFPW